MRKSKWNKQKVIEAIQLRYRSQSISSTHQQDAALYATAKQMFGSWRKALNAAGLERSYPKWTRELVIEKIRMRYKQDLPIRNMCRHDGRLYQAAVRLFESWEDALKAAGVNVAVQRKWTRELIISQLKQFHRDGVPVGQLWRRDRCLTSSAAGIFGSWRKALEASGLSASRQSWSKQRVLRELKRCRRDGLKPGASLKSAASRYFGSMINAHIEANLHLVAGPGAHPHWTPEMALEAIRRRKASGAKLCRTHKEDEALYRATLRLWGTWNAAVRAAGFTVRSRVNWLPAEEVIRRIQDRRDKGQPLVICGNSDSLLLGSAAKHFGGWRLALRAAGVETIVPQRRTKTWVVEAIRERHRQGLPLSRVWQEDKLLFTTALRKFGNWSKAVSAAGFQPIARERWTKRKIIDALQAWKREHTTGTVRTTIQRLADAAQRHFGSLEEAMEAAGVEPNPGRWTQRRVIEAIQDRYIHAAPRRLIGLGDVRLAQAAKRHFGSWEHAVEVAGLKDKIPLVMPNRRWSQESVVEAIQQWHASGKRLTDISKLDQGLCSAAKTHFGTWRKAIAAAGFQSNRRRWSRAQIIAEIQQRMACGESLSCNATVNKNLAQVASRHFGSWTNAVKAARSRSNSREGKS